MHYRFYTRYSDTGLEGTSDQLRALAPIQACHAYRHTLLGSDHE